MTEKIIKKIFIELILVSCIVLICLFSLRNNFGYITFLKMQNIVNKYKIKKEILSSEKLLKNIYLGIGEKISTEDIGQDQIKKEIDDLIALGKQCCFKIDINKDRITMSEERLKKRIVFEDLVKQLFSTEVPKRIQAISILSKIDIKRSLPYLGVLLVEPETSVRLEARKIISQIIKESSDEVKKRIPNLEYLSAANLVNNEGFRECGTNENVSEKWGSEKGE